MARLLAAAPGSRAAPGTVGDEPAVPASDTGIGASDATELLASVGFLLVPGAPFGRGPAYLMVALRATPSLAHYDPERIEYWTTERDRPTRTTLEWPMPALDASFAWGSITTVDRLVARNDFASFGGRLSTAHDGERHAAVFRSDAPILAVGGHSVSADPLGIHLAGFFAALRAVAGDPQTGVLINRASPVALYAAFLVRTLATFQGRAAMGSAAPRVSTVLRAEIGRLERCCPEDVRRGLEISMVV